MIERMRFAHPTIIAIMSAMTIGVPSAAAQTIPVEVTIDFEGEKRWISPLIYGINAYVYDSEWNGADDWKVGLENHEDELYISARRLGGNTMTSYNWESGFSNSGNDDDHSNNTFQSFITGIGSAPYEPAEAIIQFQNHSLDLVFNNSLGLFSLLQLPAAGYVAADANGAVSQAESAPSPRWKRVVNDKPGSPGSLSLTPDLDDDVVYIDELMYRLIDEFDRGESQTGMDAYELDNEPGLWHHRVDNGNEGTHSRLHPELTTATEILTKNIALAKTIRRMDPTAQIYGPAMWGYPEFHSLWNVYDPATQTVYAPEDFNEYAREPYISNNSGDDYRYNRMTWVNGYLDGMRQQSVIEGERLLDVFSVHYYPDAEAVSTPERRMQAPRSLWDPTFVESSWITKPGNGFTDGRALQLIPMLRKSIDDFYPGTNLAITEYSFGGRHDIYGGIAQADALGIFGQEGVHSAFHFGTVDDYVAAAFRLYTNLGGEGSGTYGDTALAVTIADRENLSAYAAVTGPFELHLILINKNRTQPVEANLRFVNMSSWWLGIDGSAAGFDASSPQLRVMPDFRIDSDNESITIPPLTAIHYSLAKSFAVDEDRERSGGVSIEPSIARDRIRFTLAEPQTGECVIDIFDAVGRIRTTQRMMVIDGRTIETIPVDGLDAGSYLVRITIGSGDQLTGRLLVQ